MTKTNKRKIKDSAKYNLERLFHIFIAFGFIVIGVFVKGFEYLSYIGIFIWGIILGGLNEN